MAQITLFRMGVPDRMVDVTVSYSIMDLSSNVINLESETFAVLDQVSFTKTFKIPSDLKEGKYILGLEILYENSFATSSETFNVVTQKVITFPEIEVIYVGLLLIIIVILTTTIVLKQKGILK